MTAEGKRDSGQPAADGQKVLKMVMVADRFPGRPRAGEDRRTAPDAPRGRDTTDTGHPLTLSSTSVSASRAAALPAPRFRPATSARPASTLHRHNHAMTAANIFIAYSDTGPVRFVRSPLVLTKYRPLPPELLCRASVPLRFPFSDVRTVPNGRSHCKPSAPYSALFGPFASIIGERRSLEMNRTGSGIRRSTRAVPLAGFLRWIPSSAEPVAPDPPRPPPVGLPPGTSGGRR